MLHGVTRCYRVLHCLGVKRCYMVSHGVKRCYTGLKRVTRFLSH